jgi:ABC transport system ATP-binding/permease protein
MGEHSLWISATDGRLRLHFETGSTDNLNPDPSVTLLLNTQAISKSYGATALFRNISLSINEGDRLGLIGPNGSGKSTFMEILAQRREPDAGEVVMRKGTRLAFLAQDSQFAPGETVRTVIQRALERAGVPDAERQGWEAETLGRTGFENFDAEAVALSGGWQKRLAIAEVLVQNPAILLLDEPTNHLDLAGIEWLEKLLQNAAFASVVISHDRYFLENVTTGMAELNRVYADGLFYVPGNYSAFLEKKAEYLQAQAKRQDALENRVRIEVEWLRRGPKARSTKAKGRIDTAQEMIRELADIRSRSRTAAAGLDFAATDRKTKRLLHLEHVACGFAGRTLFDDLNLAITAGKRVGLVGANGSGKTTLLRLLRGEIAPLRGEIQRAEGLRIVSFDQNRQLDPNSTLRRSLAPDSDSVIYRERVIHVASWAARFLFTSEQLNQPVGRLSGGERARVLIANLMLEPADILLLDEPTNDLDIPTLEILEESLLEFPGALVLVTHDRYLLDRVSTMVLGLDGLGGAENFADYSQWQAWLAERKQKSSHRVAQETLVQEAVFRPASARKKLSYLDTREYETIEQRIGDAEQLLEAKRAALEDPEVMKDGRLLEQTYQEMEAARKAADALYARWAELEAKIG